MRDKRSSGTHTYRNIQYMFLFNLPIFQAPHEAVTEHHPIAKQSSERSLYQGGLSHGCSAPPSVLAVPSLHGHAAQSPHSQDRPYKHNTGPVPKSLNKKPLPIHRDTPCSGGLWHTDAQAALPTLGCQAEWPSGRAWGLDFSRPQFLQF